MCQNSASYLNEFGIEDEQEYLNDLDENTEFLDGDEAFDEEGEYLEDVKLYQQTTDEQIKDHNTLAELVDSEETTQSIQKQETQKPQRGSKKTLAICPDGAAVIRVKSASSSSRGNKNQKHVCELCGNVYNKKYLLV